LLPIIDDYVKQMWVELTHNKTTKINKRNGFFYRLVEAVEKLKLSMYEGHLK